MNDRTLRLTGEQLASIEPPVSDEWFIDFDEHEDFIVASDATPVPETLDVERLEAALLIHAGEFIQQPESFDTRRLVAENIAAIYTSLSKPSEGNTP